MYVAIDDTYGPENIPETRYITSHRRTTVAVVFQDHETENIREQVRECLYMIKTEFGVKATEFHFTEIFNGRGPWQGAKQSKLNLQIFQAFAEIYDHYRWPIHVQTIDNRTLPDHGIAEIQAQFGNLDLSDRAHLSLVWLLTKIKRIYFKRNIPLTLLIDEGIDKARVDFGNFMFYDWPCDFFGKFQSSTEEPLIQVADFIAFCINRMTYLSIKPQKTKFDFETLEFLSSIQYNSPDLIITSIPEDFTSYDVDRLHDLDRINKQLPLL